MTSLLYVECCPVCAIDPQTFRQWLTQARIALYSYTRHARLMCLNIGHMQKLACLYGCVLQKEATLVHQDRAPGQMFPTAPPDANPHAHLAQLEARVATRQAQHTGLTLQLLRECTAQCLLALEAERTGGDHRSQVLRPLCYLRKP